MARTYALWCHNLAHTPFFARFFALLVLLDVAIVCVEVDLYNWAPDAFDSLSRLDFALFAGELAIVVIGKSESLITRFHVPIDGLVLAISVPDVVLKLESARVLRVVRLARLVRLPRFVRQLGPLCVLQDAITRSIRPLFCLFMLAATVGYMFAVMIVSLLPLALAQPANEQLGSLVESLHTVVDTMLFLVEAVCSAGNLGWHGAAIIGDARPHFGVILLLAVVFFAASSVRLGMGGLVTGLLLERLSLVSQREEDHHSQENMIEQHMMLTKFEEHFRAQGFSRGEAYITEEEFLEVIEAAPPDLLVSLGIGSRQAAASLFAHLCEEGSDRVSMSDVIFGIFKLRMVAKTVDMLSIDYQQEKALRLVAQFREAFVAHCSNLHVRVCSVNALFPALQAEITRLRRGIQELLDLEGKLRELRACSESDAVAGKVAHTFEELQSDFRLNKKLRELQEAVARLHSTGGANSARGGVEAEASDADAIEVVADAIALSVRATLKEELARL
eukprot:NODE_5792_length_1734_cov_10.066584.p1 GENE.NODE_5792_length_1734_cov_10.066584~~NODE_5792_length_1734_cov_10.066584.p1  ORF type:complete len:552 (-),score=160.31 NODE_5792_length_1734_cov_10.066584:78-1589(-)